MRSRPMSCATPWPNGAAERRDGAQISHLGDGRLQKRTAGLDLGWRGLVFGRHAAHRIGDARIDEREPIVRCGQVAAAGKADTFERVVEEAAGEVAGKR